MGGVDNVFTNVPKTGVVSTKNLGSGGSDHDALSATIMMPAPGAKQKQTDGATATPIEPVEAVRDAFNSQCGKLESNTKYTYDGNVWSLDKDLIRDPRGCCDLCKQDSRCHS